MERKAAIHCEICGSSTVDNDLIKKGYLGRLNNICPVCYSVGSLGLDLVTHDEYIKIKNV